MKIRWIFHNFKKLYNYKAWGEPNIYTIFKGNDWFAQIQFNGEIHTVKQEQYMNNIINNLNK